MFCPVRCSLKEIPSKGVEKIKFKGLKIIGVKSFNQLIILKLIIIKSNVTSHRSKSRYQHHHWGRTSNRTQNRTEQKHFVLGLWEWIPVWGMGNQFPDFGLRDFFDLIFCVLTCHPRADIEQNTEQNRTDTFCSWSLGMNSRLGNGASIPGFRT